MKGLIQTIKTVKHTTIHKTSVTLSIRFQLLTLTILINMNNTYIQGCTYVWEHLAEFVKM